MFEEENYTEIGGIGNYYGCLCVKEDGNFYWSIENHDGFRWERIPESLYDALMRYNEEYDNGEWQE